MVGPSTSKEEKEMKVPITAMHVTLTKPLLPGLPSGSMGRIQEFWKGGVGWGGGGGGGGSRKIGNPPPSLIYQNLVTPP